MVRDMVKKASILLVVVATHGCAAKLVKSEPDEEIHTLELTTGIACDDSLYTDRFEKAADEVCDGHGWYILERTREPSTMEGYHLPGSSFYWVVRCRE